MRRFNFHNELVEDTSAAYTSNTNHWCQLIFLPDDGVYSSAPNLVSSIDTTRYNRLNIGVSSNPATVVSNASQSSALTTVYATSTVTLGESIVLTVGVFKFVASMGTTTYDVTGIALKILAPDNVTVLKTVYGAYAGGTVTGQLDLNGFRVFRLILNPIDYALLYNTTNKVSLSFVDSSNANSTWSGMSLSDLYAGTVNASIIYDGHEVEPTVAHPEVPLSIGFSPAVTPTLWQKVLPDTSLQTLITNTYPVGSLAANATPVSSPFKFTNASGTAYIVTSIVATIKTSVSLMSATSKAKLVTDFGLAASYGGSSLGDFPAFSVTTLASTLTLATPLQLTALGSVDMTVAYSPTLKVILNPTNITPYPTTAPLIATANATITAVNTSRKVSIQMMGYAVGGATTPVAIGLPLTLNGSVI